MCYCCFKCILNRSGKCVHSLVAQIHMRRHVYSGARGRGSKHVGTSCSAGTTAAGHTHSVGSRADHYLGAVTLGFKYAAIVVDVWESLMSVK